MGQMWCKMEPRNSLRQIANEAAFACSAKKREVCTDTPEFTAPDVANARNAHPTPLRETPIFATMTASDRFEFGLQRGRGEPRANISVPPTQARPVGHRCPD